MELILTEIKKPFMCLNMIVKNESHIIKNTLTKLLNKINIDYWVISDTGSTDNTKQIINEFFQEKQIPGELFQDEWKDFGYNRTKALEHAFSKSKYLLIFDADDEICGNFVLPELTKDLYHLQFGDENGISYTRPQIINNNKKWKYVGVLHEAITCCEKMDETDTITGNYYTISGKSGARSQDPNKYLNDALILEKAYENALINKDEIYNRYGFYCANSYYDCGKYEEAIKWYKKTLNNNNWIQEKYVSCLRLFHCYNALKQKETGLFYLVESFLYDKERVECLYELVCHYCCNNLNDVAHCYYQVVKQFYNEKYLNCGLTNKLFLEVSKADFYLPYYMIIVCYSIKDYDTAIQMYRIIFTKKYKETNKTFIGNMLFNLQFYIEHANNDLDFLNLFKEYISFLKSINVSVNEYDFMEKYEKYGIVIDKKCISKNNIDKNKKYETSNKILVYTGWMTHLWNESHLHQKALGGSEKAVAYLTRELPKNYEIIVSGDVEDGVFDNRRYVNENKLQSILDTTEFHTIIISRNINFLTRYNNVKCFQLLLSLHDTHILNDNQNNILNAHNNNIDKVITLTPWHKSNIITLYPSINPDKIEIINNGIDVSLFNNNSSNKIKNKFIWSSRTERGLHILLKLWSDILEKMPDATLDICSYGDFPKDDNDRKMLETINIYNKSIRYHGKLNSIELYDLMAKTEFWLYTNTFPETSCITAMEMLMSEVICIYYPIAGLNDTVGKYGIPVNQGEEIDTILNLSSDKKALMRETGKEYALSCSWKNRAEEWSSMLGLNKTKWFFYCSSYFETKMINQYIDNLNCIYPEYIIYLTNDKNRILTEKPSKITFVYEMFDTEIIQRLPNTQFGFLNTEPLNIPVRLEHIINILKLYPNFEYYDYSKSNLKILEENEINIKDKIYLPYKCSDEELKKLINFNKNTEKEFDFGILKASGGDVTDRRLKIVNFLIERNFTVNIIEGWDDDRDKELAKCKTILNIHGFYRVVSNIFEHIRCDRLLEAGFTILSETSYKLDEEFTNKYSKLKQISYDEFLNIDVINNMLPKNICFIHSCHLQNKGLKRLEYLIDKIKTTGLINRLETIYINNIGIPIQENIYGDKFKICNYSVNPVLYEIPTINKIHQFSKENTNCNILYLHTKGINYDDNNQKENDWIDMMLYFLVEKFDLCLEKMNCGIQTVGCNYYDEQMKIRNPKHFSGNFWWADSQYISELPSLIEKTENVNPTDAEFWLCQNEPFVYEVHNSKINHYMDVYPSDNYHDNQIKIFVIHYKKLTDRKKFILTQFKKYNLTNYEFIEIDRDELDNHNTSLFDKNFGNDLTAISLSHFYAYKKIAESYDSALIFEDDAILSDNFMVKLTKYINELPADFDILSIGNGCNLHISKNEIQSNKHIYKRENNNEVFIRCTDSYIVSKKCALFLCEYINNSAKNINRAIDNWLDIVVRDNNLITYWAEPTIVTQASQTGLFDRSWYEQKQLCNNFIDFNNNFKKLSSSDFLENLYNSNCNILENLKFYFGINNKQIDITNTVIEKCMNDNKIIIPQGCNERTNIFSDPLFGVVKNIYIINNNYYCISVDEEYIYIDLNEPNYSYISESFNPDVLTYYNSPNKKVRLGKDYDGGYIICDIPDITYNLLLSCGISDDISFEEEFCDKFKFCPCYAYDGTIQDININNNNITFIKKNINNFNDDNNTNLHEIIEKYNNIFLKMDIEGYEIPWIETLNEKQINKFSQIAIEFHFPFSGKEILAFNKLNKNHILIHFHPNNCCGVRLHKGIEIPNVFECTYIHKKYYNMIHKLNTNSIPSKLDMRNVINNKEININYEPFVFNFNKPKIIDCFTFYNELDMLTYRLNILNDVVDYFVLVEATHTFIGKEKSLFYNEHKQLFEKFNHKIIHIIVDDFPHKYPNINIEKDEQWINERYQRDCISRGLDKLSLQNIDVITITDLDEIPNPKILEQIKNKDIVVDINILELDFYYYNLHSKMDHLWYNTKILTFEKYNELNIGCDKIRFYNCPIIKNAGWHLSYFGNEKFIKNKLENFSHQELNKVEFTDEKLIEERIKNGKDLFDRPTSIITIPIEENDNLPPYYDIYLTNFYTIQKL